MKIALLTCAYSAVVEHLCRITGSDNLAIVDFTKDCTLADGCRNMHITHVRFTTWTQVGAELSGFDLLVSYKLSRIIPMNIVEQFKFGGINIHPSLLPKYPGLNPWFRMYYDMDLDAGVTIHKITAKPDAGNIIARQPFRIEPGQPLPVAMRHADNIAACLLTDAIHNRLFLHSGTKQQSVKHFSVTPIKLESVKQLSVERLWHVLRGFPSLIPILYPELPHKYFEVGEYSRQPASNSVSGIADRGEKGRWIVCHDGIISLWDFSKIPMTQDYLDAVTARDFTDMRLSEASFKKNNDGSLSFIQGREAIVFRADIGNEEVAIRFPRNMSLRQIDEYTIRLKIMHRHLRQHGITHFVTFKVLPRAIELQKGVFPALIMKWCMGKNLMTYLKYSLHDKHSLASLLRHFITICIVNHHTGTVHGDIHSGNIIVDKQGNISILDIDRIWTAVFGQMKDNGGNRNWQHPARAQNKYITNRVDYFSEIIVCATIYVAMFAPDVFKQYSDDGSLFHEKDYLLPGIFSPLLSILNRIPRCEPIATLISGLCEIHTLDEIPTVETIKLFQI